MKGNAQPRKELDKGKRKEHVQGRDIWTMKAMSGVGSTGAGGLSRSTGLRGSKLDVAREKVEGLRVSKSTGVWR